jgi:hypothetical protein
VSLGAALVARTGAADDWPPPTPRYRLLATSILGGSYNPEGIEEQARLGAQMRLYRSDNPALRDNFVFVGTNPRVNPTAGRAGASIEIQPLTVFNLRFNLEFVGYFRSFGAVQSFSSPLADFSSSARERGHERGADYATTGARLSVSPFFQIKVGPIAVRDQLVFEYFAIDLRAGDSAFYEPAFDTLIPGRGKVITNDLDLFYVHDLPAGGFFGRGRIAAGARYTMFEPLFDATDFPAGDDPSKAKNGVHRVGPLVAMTLFDDGFTRFQKPTVVAFAQWYAAHRNRTGRDMPQAVPYVVLAFIFQSDLLAGSPDP